MNSPERLPTETHKPFTGYPVSAACVRCSAKGMS